MAVQPFRVAVRGYLGEKKQWERVLEATDPTLPSEEISGKMADEVDKEMVKALVQELKTDMIEMEFLDQPDPAKRFKRMSLPADPPPAPIDDERLQELAEKALNLAIADLHRHRWKGFLIATVLDEEFTRGVGLERELLKQYGQKWATDIHDDDDPKKGVPQLIVFGMIRSLVKMKTPDAVIFVVPDRAIAPTDKLIEDLKKRHEENNPEILHPLVTAERYKEGLREGLLTWAPAFKVIAQTPERVCLGLQKFDFNDRLLDLPDFSCHPQQDFKAVTKVYGEHDLSLPFVDWVRAQEHMPEIMAKLGHFQ